MAKKLSDDHLRIILDVEAKGVQAELQKITSESLRLADANKMMASEMKEAEKQMKEAEKQMKKLEDAGQRGSRAYKEWQGTLGSAKAEVADYKTKIEQNTKSINENNKQHAEIIKTMSIEDMTMSQLKQQASELQRQMNNTAASLSPEAYKQLEKELDQVNNRIAVVQNTNKSMLQQFAGMHNPVGSAARAVQGFIQVLNYMAKHPIVAVIMLIVGLLMKLKDAFSQNEEAMNSLNRIMAPFKNMLDMLINAIMEIVNWLLKFAETALNALYKLAEYIPFIGDKIKEVNEESRKQIELEKEKQELQRQHRENIVNISENEKKIAKLRDEAAQKDKYNAKERIAKLEEAKKLDLGIVEIKRQEKLIEIDILEKQNELIKGTSKWKDKIAEARAELNKIDTEYFTMEKALSRQISAAVKEDRNEAAAAAKKAMENHLKEIDKTLKLEINHLKQSRMEGLLTEKEYNDKVEELTIQSLEKKKKVKGQEAYALIEYDAQILDAQIKQQTEADTILLEELTKAKEKELSLIESGKNTRLAELQEQETDQKIYALRVAQLEAETAQARLDVIRSFGKSVEEAEFNNAKTREDAIKKSNEEIVNSEADSLKEQEKLLKYYTKSKADFERLYNIKTWEERKEIELRILEKQHAEGLMSDESYQLALIAIEKKYEDEKLKIRQQAGIATMKELYNSEMQNLEELHRQELLSEAEFEQAKLQLKLKYAQQYAQQVQEFNQIATNAVKAMEEAQTAKVETEYTKRQSALTEQYNQGIISQEEYNDQKEQLDYEQKSKELEIQKKYADVNFAMQVAQILATTAQGIITAWATSMTLGPIAGPIAAAAMSVLLGVTSAAQIAKAKAERDRVKAMTLESPNGGGNSAPLTGQIRLKEGFSEGGYNAPAGGYTGTGGKYEVAGYLPVHGGEYVIAKEELQQPEIMNMARAIERERRKRTNKNAISGFADGGSNSPAGTGAGVITLDSKIAGRIADILERLESGNIVVQTNYGVTELEAEQRRKQEAESKFTKS